MPETIKTPANIPRISRVVKFWPYRTWSPAPAMVTALMAKIEDLRAVDDFRETLAAITSPACPHAHVANHTTWEVVLQRGSTTASATSTGCR